MSKLLDYINELDSNADLLAAHDKNPIETMKAYGLSDDEIAAMTSGDIKKVAKLVGVDDPDFLVKGFHVQQK